MSELNWYWAYIPYLDTPEKQKESAISAGYGKVVFKSEADNVIAHQKYKWCLAMARIAQDDWHLHNSFYAMGHQEFEKRKCEFYDKWHRRWLELAEKFKETK